jgi:hypothetical protein
VLEIVLRNIYSVDKTLLRYLLDLLKKKYNFPPVKPMEAFLNSTPKPRNLTQLAIPAGTAQYCVREIKSILDEYTNTVFRNLVELGLHTDIEIDEALSDALEVLSTETRDTLVKQFNGGSADRVSPVLSVLDKSISELNDELQLRIKLRHLNLGDHMPYINIQDSNNISVVVSSLNTSINQIIQHGGQDAEAGRILQEFVGLLGGIKDQAKEQQELLALTRGLLKELQEPKEERNQSTMRAILEKIKAVGLTVKGAVDVLQFVNDKLPQLLILLGLQP